MTFIWLNIKKSSLNSVVKLYAIDVSRFYSSINDVTQVDTKGTHTDALNQASNDLSPVPTTKEFGESFGMLVIGNDDNVKKLDTLEITKSVSGLFSWKFY